MYYNPQDTRYDFDTDVTIEDIKTFFWRDHNKGAYFSMFETGVGRVKTGEGVRFDLIRIDPRKKYVRIFEFKSSRADFLRDKKWEKYLAYCNTLTFVCGRDRIKKDDLPSGIGLMWVWKRKRKDQEALKGLEPLWEYEYEWVKKVRKHDLDREVLLDLAMMLMFRTIWRKDDVF